MRGLGGRYYLVKKSQTGSLLYGTELGVQCRDMSDDNVI